MSKRNILVYNSSFFKTSQTFVYKQVAGLSHHHRVDLLSLEYENPHGYNLDNFKRYEISKPDGIFGRLVSKLFRSWTGSPLHLDLQSHLLLDKIFRKNNYQAIHAHFGYNGLNILHHAKKYNIPLIVTFHGHDASAMLQDEEYRKMLPELFDYATSIILVSRHMIEKLNVERWLDKVEIIPCAVDPREFNPNGYENLSDGKIRIVHAGRITDKKGVPDLINVFSNLCQKFKNLELHIAGDGSDLEKCKRLVDTCSIKDKTVFYGSVTYHEIKKILDKGDIFVLNSRVADDGDMEGTPVTLLEAMSMKKAVVSTRHAGIPFVINHGINGLLADEKNNDQLEQCLEELINNTTLRLELGKEAKRTVIESYSIDMMQQKIDHLFSNILNSETSKTPILEAVGSY